LCESEQHTIPWDAPASGSADLTKAQRLGDRARQTSPRHPGKSRPEQYIYSATSQSILIASMPRSARPITAKRGVSSSGGQYALMDEMMSYTLSASIFATIIGAHNQRMNLY
jgi:hypothetical protein